MTLLPIVLALVTLGAGGLLVYGLLRWRSVTRQVVARLHAAPPTVVDGRFTAADLDGLPTPVQRYFRTAIRKGRPLIRRARIEQVGTFLVRPERNGWGPFTATHWVATQPVGFLWDARIRMAPGLTVRVRDSLVEGSGSMVGSLLGLIPIVSVEGTSDITAGALHRYLGETVWVPTALLPSAGVFWTPIDDSAARAHLTVASTTVWLDFHFGPDGLVSRVFTPERARDVNRRGVPTPWQGRFSRYEERDGMRIPLEGEVEWLLADGPQPYWRGRITEVDYQPAAGRP